MSSGNGGGGRRVAITGTSSFMGARILRHAVETRGADAVVAVDVAHPPAALKRVRHRLVDLTLPAADRRLRDIFEEEQVGTVVHTAFYTDPRRDVAYAHELESIGTLHLMAACAAAGVEHVIQRSFTAVYGARGENPSHLTEDHPAHPNQSFWWIRDKVEAEGHALAFARRYPHMAVTILRLAPLLGPGLFTFYTRLFAKAVVPVVMGYDPLVQVLHPDDAAAAFDAALDRPLAGVFNVVPADAITLLTLLHLASKVVVHVPHPLAYSLADLAWSLGIGEAPGGFVDYVRYPFVADGARARRELGFEPRHTCRDALRDYMHYRYPPRPADPPQPALEART